MCFAIPRQVIKVSGKTAELKGGAKVKLGELRGVEKGDYLLVYGDLAITRLDRREAQRTRHLIKQLSSSVK